MDAANFRNALFTEYGKSVLSQIGKFGVTCAFAIIYVYAAELFPTVLRSTGMGMCSVMARVGSILAPIVGRELVMTKGRIKTRGLAPRPKLLSCQK